MNIPRKRRFPARTNWAPILAEWAEQDRQRREFNDALRNGEEWATSQIPADELASYLRPIQRG